MPLAVGISFRKTGKTYWFDPAGLALNRGDQVIADTATGQEIGEVRTPPHDVSEAELTLPLKPVLRLAGIDDQRRINENKLKEQQAFRTALEKITQHELPMKLVSVECAFDRSKMTFHFVAENRVDFRELAKDLARTLHCRVELHQIGVRDEAKMLGGLGTCGRELCCATFLSDFEPVGIKMAKEQDLSLNPQKISGACGRLMCCLAYEYPCYHEAKQHLPKLGSKVVTEKGPGKVSYVDVIREEVEISLEEGGKLTLGGPEAKALRCERCPKGSGKSCAPRLELVEGAELPEATEEFLEEPAEPQVVTQEPDELERTE